MRIQVGDQVRVAHYNYEHGEYDIVDSIENGEYRLIGTQGHSVIYWRGKDSDLVLFCRAKSKDSNMPHATIYTLLKAYGLSIVESEYLAKKAQFIIRGDADSQVATVQKIAALYKAHGINAALDFLKVGQ